MRNWTRRERGLGAGVVLMAVAAIAVPAWAAGGSAEELAPAGEKGDVVMAPSPAPVHGLVAAASADERRRIDACMSEHGFGHDDGGTAFELAAPRPNDGELPGPPERDPEFERAAEDCGLPAPGAAIALHREAAEGHGEAACPLPPRPLRD